MIGGNSLLRQEVFPFLGQFSLLVLVSVMGDFVLHSMDLIWVGRYLGIPGTIMILLSLLYSLRKRKMITMGSPKLMLWLHETLTWLGSLMIMVHAGVHFNAILPWLAMIFMVLNVLSGLVGQRLLHRSRQHIKEVEESHRKRGLSKEEVEKEIFWDSVAYDLMVKWRIVHFPLSLAFAVLSLGHIIAIFIFWGWV